MISDDELDYLVAVNVFGWKKEDICTDRAHLFGAVHRHGFDGAGIQRCTPTRDARDTERLINLLIKKELVIQTDFVEHAQVHDGKVDCELYGETYESNWKRAVVVASLSALKVI